MRACIIGAGIAGLCSARHAFNNGLEPVVYEQSENIGGTWQYTDDVGINKYGIQVHSSMYKHLQTNLPKELMGYPDFSIVEGNTSYITWEDMIVYLNRYTEKFDIRKHIKFLHHVVHIRPMNNNWEVVVRNLNDDVIKTEIFEFVMVCNGHNNSPVYPKLQGIESFKGKTMHSHDYRSPKTFQGENVLVIGAGPSGIDIAHSISFFAKTVVISHHNKKLITKFNSNVIQKPDVLKITDSKAVFINNTSLPISFIMYCTGYKYAFPFLPADCGISVEENYVYPLFKHVLNIQYPTMAFLGIPNRVCPTQMMDLQSRFAIAFFCQKKNNAHQRRYVS